MSLLSFFVLSELQNKDEQQIPTSDKLASEIIDYQNNLNPN